MSRIRELTRLKALAHSATNPGTHKWQDNGRLWEWFRSNPEAVIDLMIAAARWDSHPGGLNNKAIKDALSALPELKKEDAA